MIKYTVPSIVTLASHTIDCFRVLTTDYDIVLFLSTDSIKDKLKLAVPPQGIINNCDVCDVQAFFDALEESGEEAHQQLTQLLTDGLDNPTDGSGKAPVNYDINMNRLPSGMLIKLLKTVAVALDEEVYVSSPDAYRLKRKYGKPTARSRKSNKGFR